MDVYEMQPLLDKKWLKDMDAWEQTRLVCSYIHKAFFKGKPDILFPWDDMSGQSVSREDRDALVLKMKQEEKRYATKKHQG